MSRSVGVVEAVRSLLPEEAALLLGLVTQLGDTWFLLAAVLLAYWLRPGDRERTAVVIGIALGTIALLQGLKGAFGLPRPATPLASVDAYPVLLHGLFEATSTAGGHGFPSGHATLSTAVLFGLAGAVRIGTPRRRAALATGLVVVVSFSRIALGVHFLVDVIAGALLGLAVLAGTALAVRSSPADDPSTAIGLAAVVGVAAVAVTASSFDVGGILADPAYDPLLALGTTLGALAGWQAVADPDRQVARTVVAVGLCLVLVAATVAGAIWSEPAALVVGVAGLLSTGLVALPALVSDFDRVLGGYVPRWLRGGAAGTGE